MKKLILALMLLTVSVTANAAVVVLLSFQQTTGGGSTFDIITDGSHVSGIAGATNATWNWDGTTVTSVGNFNAVRSLSGNPFNPTIFADVITDLSIDTGANSATATAYSCIEGSFLSQVGANGCGGYSFGTNFVEESTTIWGPGLAVSQTLGGDDVSFGGPRSIASFDFGTVSLISGANVLAPGTIFSIGNGIALGIPDAEALIFQVVPIPAAVWLFGSALGLLGWARRRTD